MLYCQHMTSLSSMFVVMKLSAQWLQFGRCLSFNVLTVCLCKHAHDSVGKFNWITWWVLDVLLEMRKMRTMFSANVCTYYTDSFFPCIRLDIHRSSWPPDPYRSLHFYTDPFHIHWHLQNKYAQSWISHGCNWWLGSFKCTSGSCLLSLVCLLFASSQIAQVKKVNTICN